MTQLQRVLHWQPEESPAAKLDKLEQFVQPSPSAGGRSRAVVGRVTLAARTEQYPPLNLSPQRQRQLTQGLLVAWLVEEAARQPLQVTWEDVNWADPSTLEVLGLVIEHAPTVRMLNLLTYRPEFHPPWPLRSHLPRLIQERQRVLDLVFVARLEAIGGRNG